MVCASDTTRRGEVLRGVRRVDGSWEERALVRRAQTGDRRAFERLVYRYDRLVLQIALRALGDRDRAREAYVRTLLTAYQSIRRFPFDSSFRAWICRIAEQVCTSELGVHTRV